MGRTPSRFESRDPKIRPARRLRHVTTARHLGLGTSRDQVEMDPVLDHLRLGHHLEPDTRPRSARVSRHHPAARLVDGDLVAERTGPEGAQAPLVPAVHRDRLDPHWHRSRRHTHPHDRSTATSTPSATDLIELILHSSRQSIVTVSSHARMLRSDHGREQRLRVPDDKECAYPRSPKCKRFIRYKLFKL